MSTTMQDPDTWLAEARSALPTGELEHARQLCEQVIDIRPDHASARRLLARIATGLDKPELAIEHWLVLRDMRPDILETNLRLGRLYCDLDRVPEAIEAYERAAVALPEHPEAVRLLPGLKARSQPAAGPAKQRQALMPTCSTGPTPFLNSRRKLDIKGLDRAACARLAASIGVPKEDAGVQGAIGTDTERLGVVVFAMPSGAASVYSAPGSAEQWLGYYEDQLRLCAVDGSTVFVAIDDFERQPDDHLGRLCELLDLSVPLDGPVERPSNASSVGLTYSRVERQGSLEGDSQEDEVLQVYERLMQCYYRDFEILDERIVSELAEEFAGGDKRELAVKRGDLYLAGALDGERRLRLRARELGKSPRTQVQSRVLERVLERIDWSVYRQIQQFAFSRQGIKDYRDLLKYLDIDTWLPAKFRVVKNLGLLDISPQRILDIGTGPGHFPLLCQELGHDVVGMDIDCSLTVGGIDGVHIYDRLIPLFGLKRHTHRIEPFKPLPPLGPRFGLVTALMARFNGSEDRMWGPAEWRYLLDDLARNVLLDEGRIHFKLNNRSLSAPVIDLFDRLGAKVSRSTSTVQFDDVAGLCAGLRQRLSPS